MNKLKRATFSGNFEEMLNLFYELNILRKFHKTQGFAPEEREIKNVMAFNMTLYYQRQQG